MISTMAMGDAAKSQAVLDILIVFAVSAAAFMLELAIADLLPWGEEGTGALAVLAGAGTVLWLTVFRQRVLSSLGFKKPTRWWTVPIWVVSIFIAYMAAQALLPTILAPFFDIPQPDFSRYGDISGNLFNAASFAFLLLVTAAIPEEIVYRGFLIERLAYLFDGQRFSNVLAVLVQALIFGSIHFQWGIGGIVITVIMGMVWGFAFLWCGRNLWVVIIAHSTAHIALATVLYYSTPPA
ncbi:MAG: type II CAAX endopeptidase family protein [Pseudomonadota bacterium]